MWSRVTYMMFFTEVNMFWVCWLGLQSEEKAANKWPDNLKNPSDLMERELWMLLVKLGNIQSVIKVNSKEAKIYDSFDLLLIDKQIWKHMCYFIFLMTLCSIWLTAWVKYMKCFTTVKPICFLWETQLTQERSLGSISFFTLYTSCYSSQGM